MTNRTFDIRLIRQTDDKRMEEIIRECLIEFGADRPGFAWQDPELSRLSSAYLHSNTAYWVAEADGCLLGGCGIAPLLPIVDGVCELQKMYVSAHQRESGVGRGLLEHALDFAAQHYRWCYLETFSTMHQAARLYRSSGFLALPKPLVDTDHNACDGWYIRELSA